jgi:predicted ArsR family transcriptional regulator
VALAKRSNKSEALATFLTEQGYAASIESRPLGEQLCQHHCPIAHVAAEFPALCEAETEAFSRILGTHVQRLATIAHGDGVCTTYIPNTVKTKPSKKITAGKAHS